LLEAITAGKDLGRVHEIASILVRCGFGGVVRRPGAAVDLARSLLVNRLGEVG
jgi:ubiquinone biosynthesis protein